MVDKKDEMSVVKKVAMMGSKMADCLVETMVVLSAVD